MRFKATVENMVLLTNLLQSAERIGRRAIIKFTEENLFLICAKGEGDVQMWSNVPVDNIFESYRIESNANNSIAMEVFITPLVQALRSGNPKGNDHRDDAQTTIRLAKRGDEAVLCVEVKGTTRDGKKLNVSHEVHILVRKPAEIDEMSQPKCPPLEAHIELPSANQCRPVVDHLHKVGDVIWVGATRNGRLRLSIKSNAGDIETMWTNLRNTSIVREGTGDQSIQDESDASAWHVVPISARILHKWFSSQVLQNHVIAAIAPMYCLVAYVYVGDRQQGGIITYYLPARNMGYE